MALCGNNEIINTSIIDFDILKSGINFPRRERPIDRNYLNIIMSRNTVDLGFQIDRNYLNITPTICFSLAEHDRSSILHSYSRVVEPKIL